MRHKAWHAMLAGCLLLACSCSRAPSDGAASEQEFIERFLAATQARSVDQLLPLYCWDDVDGEMKTWVVDSMVRRLIYLDAVSARYVPASFDRQPTTKIKGKEYQPSLDITGYLEIELDGGLAASMPVGKKAGRFYFVVMAARRGKSS